MKVLSITDLSKRDLLDLFELTSQYDNLFKNNRGTLIDKTLNSKYLKYFVVTHLFSSNGEWQLTNLVLVWKIVQHVKVF